MNAGLWAVSAAETLATSTLAHKQCATQPYLPLWLIQKLPAKPQVGMLAQRSLHVHWCKCSSYERARTGAGAE